jgi:hypothetical protein
MNQHQIVNHICPQHHHDSQLMPVDQSAENQQSFVAGLIYHISILLGDGS